MLMRASLYQYNTREEAIPGHVITWSSTYTCHITAAHQMKASTQHAEGKVGVTPSPHRIGASLCAPGMRPPPAKKQAMVVREAPPVCLRNIFASDEPREDDEHNALMHSLPRGTGHGHSRFECAVCPVTLNVLQ